MARSYKLITTTFLRWECQYLWLKNYGEPATVRHLAIVVARDGDRLVGILPGYICSQKNSYQNHTVFYFIGSEFESTDYLDIIWSPEIPYDKICNELFSLAINLFPGLDLICCRNLLNNIQLVNCMETLASNLNSSFLTQHHRVCPFVTPKENWEAYLAKRGRNLRSNLRRKTRKLYEINAETFHVLTSPRDCDYAMTQLFRLHDLRFKQLGEESKFVGPLRKTFHFAISKRFAESDILRIFQLRKDTKVLATLYCFLYNNELFYFQAGMDPEWHKSSVGMVLMGKVIHYVHKEGFKRFDFMRGSEAYKYKWTDQIRKMCNVYIATSSRGKRIIRYKKTYALTKKGIRHFIPGI